MKKQVMSNKIILSRNPQLLKFKKKENFFKYKVLSKTKFLFKYRKLTQTKDTNL